MGMAVGYSAVAIPAMQTAHHTPYISDEQASWIGECLQVTESAVTTSSRYRIRCKALKFYDVIIRFSCHCNDINTPSPLNCLQLIVRLQKSLDL